jgi:hypothetical protein
MMTIFHRPSSIRNAVSIPVAAINGARRVADRSHGFRVRDHAWMIAAGNVVDPDLVRVANLAGCRRNDLVGIPYDVPGGNRLPSHSFRRFVLCATFCERALRSG